MAVKSLSFATRTTDLQITTGTRSRFYGYSVRESATTAAVATFAIRNGTGATADIVAVCELAANASNTVVFPEEGGVLCEGGVYLDIIAGEIEGCVYIEA